MAKLIVEKNLNVECFLHDNGKLDGMYDLRVGHDSAPEIALEVTGAVDAKFTETWNIGPAKPAARSFDGTSWMVEISDDCSIKQLDAKLPALLKRANEARVQSSTQNVENGM